MRHPIAEAIDSRLAESLTRVEERIDYRPVKVVAWGFAAASVFGATAAGFAAVAAMAGAYVAVRRAVEISRESNAELRDDSHRSSSS